MNNNLGATRTPAYNFWDRVFRNITVGFSKAQSPDTMTNAIENMGAFSVNSLGEAWLFYLSKIFKEGAWIKDGEDKLLEICNVMVNIKFINESDPIIKRYADDSRIKLMRKKYLSCEVIPPYRISYGQLLYANNGIDQIEWVVKRLQQKSESKSATITLHSPGDNDLSCLSMLDFKIRNRKLVMIAIYRSQNVFASQPGNLLVLRKIQEDVADQLSCKIGSIGLLPISAHIYEKDIEIAKKILDKAQVSHRGVFRFLQKKKV